MAGDGAGADALRKNWLASLAHERRASPHTLRAYGDDVARFLGFQARPSGRRGDAKGAGQADARRYPRLHHRAPQRRAWARAGCSGRWRRCAASTNSSRSEGILENAAARAIRTPRVRRGLAAALVAWTMPARAIEEAGEHDVEWLGARDAALLTLALWRGPAHFRGAGPEARRCAVGRNAHRDRQGPQGTQRAGAAAGARRRSTTMPRKFPSPARRPRRCSCRGAASR